MRGRRPKPLAILDLDGTRRRDRHGVGPEVKPDSTVPVCPTWLGVEGKAEWRRVVPALAKLGMLSSVDRGSLSLMCEAWETIVVLRRKITEMLKRNDCDVMYQRLCHQKNSATVTYNRISSEFGLNPSSRARLRPGVPTQQPTNDEEQKAKDACGF